MSRHHMTAEGPIPVTAEEEAEWDAMEAARAAERANPTPVTAPTKEELMAQLNALSAQIQALE